MTAANSVSQLDQQHNGAAQRVANAVGVEKRATFVVDTNVYAAGELVADLVAVDVSDLIDAAAEAAGGCVILDQFTVYDKADQTAGAYYLVVADENTSLGTINGAPNISDANAIANRLRVIPIASTDWVDLGGIKVATVRNVNLRCHLDAADTNLYIGLINGAGTPTFGAVGDVLADLVFA